MRAAGLSLLAYCAALASTSEVPSSHHESATLDSVILSMIQQLWGEPATYRGSGAHMPEEWRDTFRHLVEGTDTALLATPADSAMRAKLLDHISLRKALDLERSTGACWD